jgi:tRNA (guanine-N7-)-methyltransferase
MTQLHAKSEAKSEALCKKMPEWVLGGSRMRMRRKKNMTTRIERQGALLLGRLHYIANAGKPTYGDFTDALNWHAVFGNDLPVCLEIGCGKGGFAVVHAVSRPQFNIVAMEKCENVAVTALESATRVQGANLGNLRFVIGMAEFLPVIIPPYSISRIYLNFSCPFPKNSYAAHRLTHPRFLDIYRMLLRPGGEVWQKTDNHRFFEYSRFCFRQRGWQILAQTDDLGSSHIFEPDGNIITEYESKFVGEGRKIHALRAAIG